MPASRPCRRLVSLGPAALAWILAAEAQAAASAESSGQLAAGYLAQLLGSLVLVILVILMLAWLLRRLPAVQGQGQGQALIQILAVRSIGARERLMLVQVGEEQVLIGVAPTGVRTLHRLSTPVEVTAQEPWKGDFASLLGRIRSGGSP
ncbi:flagellar biosynthetic protein FliO [Thiocystis violacea]|uniref:flagellar biosynthetic protein FliO n=1 Tax=Thiocystis violacea TaxID=13725 RepID=UPI0019066EF2|nr:flagellar biosynthetic protein FliO [Thiocystis violacea]MBK1721308.1 flagellar biosynthetic protein FliO [Thiocystis violacea]